MKKTLLALALVVTSACATFPPKNSDGTVNIPVLLDYAQYGIDADCKFGAGALAADICTFGTDTITLAKSNDAKDVRPLLVAAEAKVPKIKPYIDFVLQYLP